MDGGGAADGGITYSMTYTVSDVKPYSLMHESTTAYWLESVNGVSAHMNRTYLIVGLIQVPVELQLLPPLPPRVSFNLPPSLCPCLCLSNSVHA